MYQDHNMDKYIPQEHENNSTKGYKDNTVRTDIVSDLCSVQET